MKKKTTERLTLPVPGKLGRQLAAMGFRPALVIEGPLTADDVARARAAVSTVGTWERKIDAALATCAALAPVDAPAPRKAAAGTAKPRKAPQRAAAKRP